MSTVKRSGGDEGSSGSCIKKLKQEIDDITECAICKETLSNARMLSCCHLFCLECLKKFCENKVERDDISCPVCRRHSQIPSGGVEKFPLCHFINKLIDVNKLTDKNSEKNGCCSPCLAIGRRETAAGYCFECREDLCEPCADRHKVMNISKSHRIVDLDSKPEAKQLLKSAVSFCQEHPDQRIHFYCNDCKTVACVACNMVKHKGHVYSDIKDTSQIVTSILDNHCERVRKFITETEDALSDVEDNEWEFDNAMEGNEATIRSRYANFKQILDSQHDQLMNELTARKLKYERDLDKLKDEFNSELTCMKSFEKYWFELKECGSACDIAQAASSLQETVEELIFQHEMKHRERKRRAGTNRYWTHISEPPVDLNKVSNLLGKINDYEKSSANGDTSNSSESDDSYESDRDGRVRSDETDQDEEEDGNESSQSDQEDEPESGGDDQNSSWSDESSPSPRVATRSHTRVRPSRSTVSNPSGNRPFVGRWGLGAPAQTDTNSVPSAPASTASVAIRSNRVSSAPHSKPKSKKHR